MSQPSCMDGAEFGCEYGRFPAFVRGILGVMLACVELVLRYNGKEGAFFFGKDW